ncbi:Hint domain-containing protein [Thalassobius sp. Cn5-15]|uniref:Hint domain-containing protein n=1 Tax=Thalassobius sp. Cn5-15 TaxID=2917763 RepID=UPI001EF316BC|nr:Hint domain-containing protein [Thalassobius sp. Cn5-15]MCG7492888.1 Hint domain-containing protein [Thalassobius sp. Cn5-15]
MNDFAPYSTFNLSAYRSGALQVSHGANLGDALSFADELVLDDTYFLKSNALKARLSVVPGRTGAFTIAQRSDVGCAGAALHLDSCLTFMSPDGRTTEMLVLVEVDEAGDVAEVYALPLSPLMAKTDLTLVGIDKESAHTKLAEIACVSFTSGTRITMATGEQRRVEDLRVGDRVLTRDDGPQVLRWVGQSTVRALGEFAPVLIKAGTMHNADDLIVSPEHRLFVYQRTDELGAGRAEVLIKARDLVNGRTVVQLDGGFVEYYQLLFDDHQIIYAEGIAAETLLADMRTSPALPDELAKRLETGALRHSDRSYLDFSLSTFELAEGDVTQLLRRASTG